MVGRHGPRSTCPLPRVPAPHAHWRPQGGELWSGGTRSRSPWPRQNPPGPPWLGGGPGPASPCPRARGRPSPGRGGCCPVGTILVSYAPSRDDLPVARTPPAHSRVPGATRRSLAEPHGCLPGRVSCHHVDGSPVCRVVVRGPHASPSFPPRPAPLLTHRSIRPFGAFTLTERGRPVNTAIRRASVLLEGTVGA
jgi:hypothetical protein